jgi:hypothetical protein
VAVEKDLDAQDLRVSHAEREHVDLEGARTRVGTIIDRHPSSAATRTSSSGAAG